MRKTKCFLSSVYHFIFSFIPGAVQFDIVCLCSLLMQTSHTNWIFGDGSFTSFLPKRSSKFSPSKMLENNYFCLLCTKARILTICWVTESIKYMFQWFEHICFPTVWWPYYHDSEFSTVACEKISVSISINIAVDSVVLNSFRIIAVQPSLTTFFTTLSRTSFIMYIVVFFSHWMVPLAVSIFHVFPFRSCEIADKINCQFCLTLLFSCLGFAINFSFSANVFFFH